MVIKVEVYPLVRSVCSGLRGVVLLLMDLFFFFPLPFFFFPPFGWTSVSGEPERASKMRQKVKKGHNTLGFSLLLQFVLVPP